MRRRLKWVGADADREAQGDREVDDRGAVQEDLEDRVVQAAVARGAAAQADPVGLVDRAAMVGVAPHRPRTTTIH